MILIRCYAARKTSRLCIIVTKLSQTHQTVQPTSVERCQVTPCDPTAVVLVSDHRLPLHEAKREWNALPLLRHISMGRARERGSSAVLQQSCRKRIRASGQRAVNRRGQPISVFRGCAQDSMLLVVVRLSKGKNGRIKVRAYSPTLEPSKKRKKSLFSSTPRSERIVEMLPRRADLSLPVGTYLSPSLFPRLPLKGRCFNLRCANWRLSWVSTFYQSPMGKLSAFPRVEENMTTFSKQKGRERKDRDVYLEGSVGIPLLWLGRKFKTVHLTDVQKCIDIS